MNKSSTTSSLAEQGFNTDYVRNLVDRARANGLIHRANEATPTGRPGTEMLVVEGVQFKQVLVTPELAAKWLENNFRNRPLRRDTVAAYARDMRNGKWKVNHQGIAFNELEELIDGQHRLSAIVEAAMPVLMLVTYGWPVGTDADGLTVMDTVDRGATRSVPDQLRIQHGIEHASMVNAICTSIAYLTNDSRTRRLSVGEVLSIYRTFEGPIKHVIAKRNNRAGLKQAGVRAAFAFAGLTHLDILDMYSRLMVGRVTGGMPMQHLYSMLTSETAVLLNRGSDRALAELVLWAITLETRGETIEQLTPDPRGLVAFRTLLAEQVKPIAALFVADVATPATAARAGVMAD